MKTQFSCDLRLARKRAGLIQSDIAHLMGIYRARYSQLERGLREPTQAEFFALSIILDRQFTSYCLETMEEHRVLILERLPSLPEPIRKHPNTNGRTLTLARLRQLDQVTIRSYEA